MKVHQTGPQSYTLTTRDGGQQLKHTRLATGGEREEEKRQTEQKRQHQKCRLGILSRATKGNSNPRLKGNRKGIIVKGKEFYIPILNTFPTR